MATIGAAVLNMYDRAMWGGSSEKVRAVAKSYAELDSVMSYIPVKTDNIHSIEGKRFTGYNDDNDNDWGPSSQDPKDTKENPDPWSELSYLHSFRITLSEPDFEDRNSPGREAMFKKQFKIKLEKQSFDLDNKFFNNRHTGTGSFVNKYAPLGLRARLSAANRERFGIPASMKKDMLALDLSPAASTASDIQKLGRAVEEMAFSMAGKRDMSDLTIFAPLQVWHALEYSYLTSSNALWSHDTDKLGRRLKRWAGARCVTTGLRMPVRSSAGQAYILSATEAANGETIETGATGLTSIFIIKGGAEDFYMNQFHEATPSPIMKFPGTLDHHSTFWNKYMLVQQNGLCVAQLHNVKVA